MVLGRDGVAAALDRPRQRELLRPRALARVLPRPRRAHAALAHPARAAGRARVRPPGPRAVGRAPAPRRARRRRPRGGSARMAGAAPDRPPASAPNQLGLYRLCLSHPDLDALHARMRARGRAHRGSARPDDARPSSGLAVRFFCSFDPDGTCVEFIEQPGAVRLLHVNVNCRDLDRSTRFYQEVLGLAPLMARSQPGPVDGARARLPGRVRIPRRLPRDPGPHRPDHRPARVARSRADRQARGVGEPARLVPARLSRRGRARVLRRARPPRRRALGPVLARHGARDPDRRPERGLLPRSRRHLPRADRAAAMIRTADCQGP